MEQGTEGYKPTLNSILDTFQPEKPQSLPNILQSIHVESTPHQPDITRITNKSLLFNKRINPDQVLAMAVQLGGLIDGIHPTPKNTAGAQELDFEVKSNENRDKKTPAMLERVKLTTFGSAELSGARSTNLVVLTTDGSLRKALTTEQIDNARKWFKDKGLTASYQGPISQFIIGNNICTDSVAFIIEE